MEVKYIWRPRTWSLVNCSSGQTSSPLDGTPTYNVCVCVTVYLYKHVCTLKLSIGVLLEVLDVKVVGVILLQNVTHCVHSCPNIRLSILSFHVQIKVGAANCSQPSMVAPTTTPTPTLECLWQAVAAARRDKQ